jgi:hypothetical protein
VNKKIVIAAVAVTAGFLLRSFFSPGNTQEFSAAYHAYDTASTAEENAAHTPGAGENVPRQKLNEILSRALTENLTPEERQKLSEEGLVLAQELRAQIDAIGEAEKKTETALAILREASKKVRGFSARRKTKSIIALADERSRIITEIKEISYGTNDRLEDIFRGIIADNGALTPARIGALNKDLPETEKQFDRLTESYRQLDEMKKEIDMASAP